MQTKKPCDEMTADKPLNLVAPELHQIMLTELSLKNIHPYDIKASGISDKDGIQVKLRYGDGFKQLKTVFFKQEDTERTQEVATDFFQNVGEEIKKVMIADYFKMMKP